MLFQHDYDFSRGQDIGFFQGNLEKQYQRAIQQQAKEEAVYVRWLLLELRKVQGLTQQLQREVDLMLDSYKLQGSAQIGDVNKIPAMQCFAEANGLLAVVEAAREQSRFGIRNSPTQADQWRQVQLRTYEIETRLKQVVKTVDRVLREGHDRLESAATGLVTLELGSDIAQQVGDIANNGNTLLQGKLHRIFGWAFRHGK